MKTTEDIAQDAIRFAYERHFSTKGWILDKYVQETLAAYLTRFDAPTLTGNIDAFFLENICTVDEQAKLKAFLFALRHNDVDITMLEGIVKKYSHIL